MWRRKKNIDKLKLALKQKKACELIESMLESNIDIHFGPISNEYFILDRINHINICISDNKLKVANHGFLYTVSLSLEESARYIKMVEKKIQEKSDKIKKELFRNEIELLSNLINMYGKQTTENTENN